MDLLPKEGSGSSWILPSINNDHPLLTELQCVQKQGKAETLRVYFQGKEGDHIDAHWVMPS